MKLFKWLFKGWDKKSIKIGISVIIFYLSFSLTAIPYFFGVFSPAFVALFELSILFHSVAACVLILFLSKRFVEFIVDKVYDGKS